MAKNTADRPNWEIVRETWKEAKGDLQSVFVKLNWGRPALRPFSVQFGETDSIEVKPISQLRSFHAFEIDLSTNTANASIRQIQKEIAKTHPDNVLIVKDENQVRFEWPRRKPDGGIKYDTFTTGVAIPNQLACQKLAGVGFGVIELGSISLEDVRSRVYGLASEDVTKKFYDQFRKEHKNIAHSITSNTVLSEPDRLSYSSLLLNRLMFVYFLQKKEFLHNDPNLLRNGLRKCDVTSLNFYRDALLPLFFDGFNGQNQNFSSPQLDALWGKIPYINGGIFARIGLESRAELEIPNAAFEELFDFFDSFNWHLDARPLGSPNEINPEVLGYIFEQYINETADGKKEGGAYYTPDDVTGYMVAQTLIPRVLDEFIKIWPNCLTQVKANPEDYLHRSLLHGRSTESSGSWIEAPAELQRIWEEDPISWAALDEANTLVEICLPGETWVETFYRRERVDKLIDLLRSNGVGEVNELITYNLNGAQLVSDTIAMAVNSKDLVSAWKAVTELSVIDPTCGSGAFLFAALTSLESVYEDILDALGENRDEVGAHFADGNLKYKVRKHVAMRNLYGTDLMADAIETAKLRVFLALAAVLENAIEIEPLPDLDFNLKAGNLVIGLFDFVDAKRINRDEMLDGIYDFEEIEQKTAVFQDTFRNFKDAEIHNIGDAPSLKVELLRTQSELRELTNKKFIEILGEGKRDDSTWLMETKAFHWFAEFPEIVERGGFDVVIGNPPYMRTSSMDQDSRDAISTYKSRKVPDFYATCFERTIQLLAPTGRHSLIVMLNLAHSDQYAPLRAAIDDTGFSEWWSTYGKWPTQLFRGVRVANTLLILGPGGKKHSTRHHIFGSEVRARLFDEIEYFAFERFGTDKPIRGGLIADLFREILSREFSAASISNDYLYLRPTAQYWFPLLFGVPPVLNSAGEVIKPVDAGVIPLELSMDENWLVAGATLAGKIGYGWWSSIGDDFNVVARQADAPRMLAKSAIVSTELEDLALAVKEARRGAAFVSKNNDGYINVRWTMIRRTTDLFDRALLETTGLGAYWRPLNIWYRQSMRSSRDNHNSRYLTPEEVDRFLAW